MPSQPIRVAIDLETTGLNPESDAIIEIGAVKFVGERVLDTFHTFVAPGIALPYRIQRLTGIAPAALRGAPPLPSIAPGLRAFLGEAALVGHNVPFDASFLRRAGLAERNPLLDTYELASMLLPTLRSFTLASVGAALGVSSPTHHRALADAHLAREVFLALLARLEQLAPGALDDLDALAAPATWSPLPLVRSVHHAQHATEGGGGAFGGMLKSSLGEQLAAKLGLDPAVLGLPIAAAGAGERVRVLRRDDGAASVAIASPTGAEASVTPPPLTPPEATRESISASVARCLAEGGALVIEAQGDDASLDAHLIPTLRWAAAGEGRVLICTAGTAGMARVAREALPRAFAQAGLAAADVRVAELGEHEAYLCLHRWFGLGRVARDGVLPRDVTRGLAKLAVWAHETTTGERSEVVLGGQEWLAWDRTRAGAEYEDSAATCPYRRDGYCFVARAQDGSDGANVVVTTHAALAAMLTGRDPLLPAATRVVILDAHMFEEELRRVRSIELDLDGLRTLLTTLAEVEENGGRAGLLHLAAAQMDSGRERAWFEVVARTRSSAEDLFRALGALLPGTRTGARNGRGDAPEHRVLRLDDEARQSAHWREVQRTWGEHQRALVALTRLVREIAEAARVAGDAKQPVARNGVATELLAMARRLDHISAQMGALIEGSDDERMVSWLRLPYPSNGEATRGAETASPAAQGRGGHTGAGGADPAAEGTSAAKAARPAPPPPPAEPVPTLHSAPVHVGPLLAPLYAPGQALVLSGPALAVGGDFEHVRGVFSLPEGAQSIAVAADYAQQTLLGLPSDVPEPNAPQYQQALETMLISLGRSLKGRVVAIFPSHAALRASATGIRRALERDDVLVLAQGIDGSARQLWQTFRTQPRVVLLGAGNFWDGSEQREGPPACVVVARVPFPALSDPIIAARAEQWPDPQNQFVVPLAALRLRQALNGLAWSHGQKNAVILFDRRMQTRSYGPLILATLPRCTQYQDSAALLAERVAEWVGPA